MVWRTEAKVMGLFDNIKQNKTSILEWWFELICKTYPSETYQHLKKEKDRFLNPVGYTVKMEIDTILEELTGEMNSKRLGYALENIIRIRAVQDFTPSGAIGFIHLLKKAISVNSGIGNQGPEAGNSEAAVFEESLELDQRIDTLLSMAFDIYTECREKIYKIKIREINAGRMIDGK